MPADSPAYDCQGCGACCADSLGAVGYVLLRRVESKRAGRMGLPVIEDSGCAFLGTVPHTGKGGATICVAFDGTVGGICRCSIYAGRPRKCQQFTVGGRACRKARKGAGLPV